MEDLLAQDTYACGTVRSNQKDLPPCAKNKLRQGEKVCTQRGKIIFTKWHDKRDILFLSTNVLPSEQSCLVPRKKTREIFNSSNPVLLMFTLQTWEELTTLISFGLFILPVIPHENDIGISFGFYSVFQFVIVSSSNQSIAQIKESESDRDQLQA